MTQPPPPPGYAYQQPQGEDSTLSVLVHLSWFLFALLGPLVVYLVVKNDPAKPMTRHHAAEALNFHLTMTIAFVVSGVLVLVLIGLLMLLVCFVWGTVFAIVAAVAAGRREPYRYPLTIRFVH